MDINPTFNYNNAEIEIVVEDDVIATSRVTMDGECVNVADITDENGNDVPYTPKNRTAVVKMCMEFIDKELAEDGRTEGGNMALVRR